MIPLRDVIPSRTTPWITLLLIAIALLVFLCELALGADERTRFVFAYGLIPTSPEWITTLTSLFVHGGWLSLAANGMALWIFGATLEDRMGHGRFLGFYLLSGVAGNLLHAAAVPGAEAPLLGSSAAVAGVVAAYLVLFPYSRVLVLVLLVAFNDVVEVPAAVFATLWLFLLVLSGIGALAYLPRPDMTLWSELGGSLTGVAAVWVLRRPERDRVEWWG